MSTLRQNGSSPTGLFIHLHALPQSQCLPFCHFISVNSPSGTWEETSKHRVHFWDVEGGKRNVAQRSHWVMNSVLTQQVTVMYHPFFLYVMWHIKMMGVTAGSDGCCSAAGADVQNFALESRNSSQGWCESKIKGVWSLTVPRLRAH